MFAYFLLKWQTFLIGRPLHAKMHFVKIDNTPLTLY